MLDVFIDHLKTFFVKEQNHMENEKRTRSGSKRYYWMRLKADFFESPEIRKLRKLAGGDT